MQEITWNPKNAAVTLLHSFLCLGIHRHTQSYLSHDITWGSVFQTSKVIRRGRTKCHFCMPQVEFHYKRRNTLKHNVDFICQMLGSCVKNAAFVQNLLHSDVILYWCFSHTILSSKYCKWLTRALHFTLHKVACLKLKYNLLNVMLQTRVRGYFPLRHPAEVMEFVWSFEIPKSKDTCVGIRDITTNKNGNIWI